MIKIWLRELFEIRFWKTAYEIARNCGYDGYQVVLASMVYKFSDKKTGWGISVNEQLAQELQKPVLEAFKRMKTYARFKDNIWAADLAEMWSLSPFNHGIKCLLCVIDAFIKYAWIKSLTDKKAKTVLHGLIGIVNESKHKPNKLWVDQGREFYNKLTQNS